MFDLFKRMKQVTTITVAARNTHDNVESVRATMRNESSKTVNKMASTTGASNLQITVLSDHRSAVTKAHLRLFILATETPQTKFTLLSIK